LPAVTQYLTYHIRVTESAACSLPTDIARIQQQEQAKMRLLIIFSLIGLVFLTKLHVSSPIMRRLYNLIVIVIYMYNIRCTGLLQRKYDFYTKLII